MKTFIVTVLLLVASIFATAQNGVVKGRIFDAASNEPLPFVNVVISGTTIGTVTDLDGNFQFFGLQPGFIRLESSFVGYKNAISSEFEVSNANVANIEIPMEVSDQQIGEVTVKASPFRKTEESPVSLRTIGVQEIETNPGANRDISKVIQSFPGVGSSVSFRNDIIIRGGGPSESRFYLDDVEVPNINHFATQGASGGPVGIINADFIREVNFYSGAFPSNRGNALSGVLEFKQIDGNSEDTKFRFSLGASEVSATVDGPIGEKTTYIVSARRSYLQFLFSLIELPFLPTFNDMQFKVRTRINKNHEIYFVGLGAIDQFALNTGIEDPDESQDFILSSIPVNEQWTYTLGGVYKYYHDNGYLTAVASRNHLNNSSYKYFDNDESDPENLVLDYNSEEIENKFRVENTNRFNNGWKLNYGVNVDFAKYTNDTYQKRFFNGQLFEIDYDSELNLTKWGLFAQGSKSLLADQLIISAGIRMDANNYSESMSNMLQQFSPRLSVSYQLSDYWSINANTGRYYQLPPYTALGYRMNDELVNKNNGLKYIESDHFIAGFGYQPDTKWQFTVEGFLKNYRDYPFSVKDQISLATKGADFGVVGDEEITSTSEGRAYGAEFLVRYNNQKSLNLNAAYTLVRSEFADTEGEYIPTTWDSKHLITMTASQKLQKNWRVGFKWRFVGGLPYTPYDMEKSALISAWNANGGPYLDYDRLNSERFKSFQQLDLRIDKLYYFDKFTAKFYIDIQNAYNFQSESQDIVVRNKDADGNYVLTNNNTSYDLRRLPNSSGTVLPTIGIILEF